MQRPAPLKPVARKARCVNAEYEDKAREMGPEAMRSKSVIVDQLTAGLALMGVDMSSGGVANKISRGGFSSAFLLQRLAAMGLEIRVE